MHPLPKPAIISLLTSLVTASVQNDSSPPDPLLLLPSNSTATPPNSSPADPRYPSATSIPANPTDNTTLNASSPRAPRIIRSGRNLRLASCLRRPRPHGRHLRAQNLRGSATPTLPGLARWDANLPLRILGRSRRPLRARHNALAAAPPPTPSRPRSRKSHARALVAVCAPSLGGVVGDLAAGGKRGARDGAAVDGVPRAGGPRCRRGGERFGPAGDVLSRVVVPWRRRTGEGRCEIDLALGGRDAQRIIDWGFGRAGWDGVVMA
ncbi:hypothetical protein HO173_006410 [Letharia columbiana]|uniref:Uncharacterized protein n=1 Tax=Letharia columbiana TaxID=112416 RepID=A0A8H6L4I4_9LECA|nr:uncharacterized protein HO173_006410 [Letharia columbiana]KAF6235216.1 hypothetical protein HO173_006410 [Letharia columbiana]